MASREFRDLAESQRKTVEVLRILTSELRRGSDGDDMKRLLAPLVSGARRFGAEVRDPAVATSMGLSALAQTGGGILPDTVLETGNVERALNLSTTAIRDLGSTLALNTRSLDQNTSGFASGIQGLLAALTGNRAGAGGIGGLLKGGLGLVPLGLKIVDLFRREKNESDSFKTFELPPSVSVEAFNAVDAVAGFPRVARGQRGELRAIPGVPGGIAQPQVVVNVSALDTQSIVDRSSDIARAVREAMLHMHPVNDMIGEI